MYCSGWWKMKVRLTVEPDEISINYSYDDVTITSYAQSYGWSRTVYMFQIEKDVNMVIVSSWNS